MTKTVNRVAQAHGLPENARESFIGAAQDIRPQCQDRLRDCRGCEQPRPGQTRFPVAASRQSAASSSPPGRKTIAQRFNAGYPGDKRASPVRDGRTILSDVFFRPFGASGFFGGHVFPAMNRWAIFGRPCGTPSIDLLLRASQPPCNRRRPQRGTRRTKRRMPSAGRRWLRPGRSRSPHFISALSTSIAFSICRSWPARKSSGVLSTYTSGCTP